MSTALANVDADSVIERIASGEYQSHIAAQLGIPKQSLHNVISKHPAYREALKLRNMAKLDQAQEAIENPEGESALAKDLARAREAFKAAAWRAERECPGEWGNKTQISGSDGQPLQINNIAITFVQAESCGNATIVESEQPLTLNAQSTQEDS